MTLEDVVSCFIGDTAMKYRCLMQSTEDVSVFSHGSGVTEFQGAVGTCFVFFLKTILIS